MDEFDSFLWFSCKRHFFCKSSQEEAQEVLKNLYVLPKKRLSSKPLIRYFAK